MNERAFQIANRLIEDGADPASDGVLAACDRDEELAREVREIIADIRAGRKAAEAAFGISGSVTATASNASTGRTLKVGNTLGKLTLRRKLGAGGFGEVWEAHEDLGTGNHRQVAVKVLKNCLQLDAMRKETQAVSKLANAGAEVVAVWSFHDDPRPHLVMPLQRTDLMSFREQHPCSDLTSALKYAKIVADVANTLHKAHEQDLVHRDIKPANILLNNNDKPLVSDWGLVANDAALVSGAAGGGLTPAYAAPEQFGNDSSRINRQTDIYSLGVLLFELLMGELPPRADERARQEANANSSPAFLQGLDKFLLPAIRPVCEKALALSPNDRYSNAAEMAAAIREVIDAVERPGTYQPVDFSSLVHRKRAGFFGREWLFEEIDAWAQAGSRQVLLVVGEPGSGKSAIEAELVPDLLVPRDRPLDLATEHAKAVKRIADRVIAFHFCEYGRDDDALNASRFVASISAMLVKTLPQYATQVGVQSVQAALQKDAVTAFKEAVLDPLRRVDIPEGEFRYLLIDALDEAEVRQDRSGPSIVEVLAHNIDHLPSWLRIIATVRRRDPAAQRFSNVARSIELEVGEGDDAKRKAAKRSDLRGYMLGRLGSPNLAESVTAEAGRTHGTGKSIRRRLADELLGKAEDNFLYAVEALRQMEETGSLDVSRLPSGLFGLYDGHLRRHYPKREDYEEAGAMRILMLLSAAFAPPPRHIVAAASGLDADRLPGVWSNLGTYVVEVDGAVRFYHRSFRDWLADKDNTTYGVAPLEGHRLWTSYGCDAVRDDPSRTDEYLCRELVWHLWQCTQDSRVECRRRAREWLIDLYGNGAYVQRCRELRGTRAVLEDFGMVFNAIPQGQDNANGVQEVRAAAFAELGRASGRTSDAEGVSWYRTVPNVPVPGKSLLVSLDGSNLLLGYQGGLMEWRIDAAERGYFEKRLTWREGELEADEVRERVTVRPLSWHPCRDEALLIIGDQGKSAVVIWQPTKPHFRAVGMAFEKAEGLNLQPFDRLEDFILAIDAIDAWRFFPLGAPEHACWIPSDDGIYLADENGSIVVADFRQNSWRMLRDGVDGRGPTGIAVVDEGGAGFVVAGPGPVAQLRDRDGTVADEMRFGGVESLVLVGAHGNRVALRLDGGQRSGHLCVIDVADRRLAVSKELKASGVACLLPGGRWLAVGDENGAVTLRSICGEKHVSFPAHVGAVESIAAGGGSTPPWTLCTAGADQVVRVWRCSPRDNG